MPETDSTKMPISLIPYSETGHFSGLITDYLTEDKKISAFYKFPCKPGSFHEAIEQRKKNQVNRKVLSSVLQKQYGQLLQDGDPVLDNISSLQRENTFSVTTGHQLNLLTGPLYVIYKIATTIQLSRQLQNQFPEHQFVPVFWMAGEDHDFEEINHIHIGDQKITWDTPQSGAVGRFHLKDIESFFDDLNDAAGNRYSIPSFFRDAYTQSKTLAEATRKLIHGLFAEYGLVVIDGDDPELKALFVSEMETELTSGLAYRAMNETNGVFSRYYKEQVVPQEINLFYLMPGKREKIVSGVDGFSIRNSELHFTKQEMVKELHKHPERFSPNVVMRPVYQERILPNLAYIGGPGEVHYWLQLMNVFDRFEVPYPIVMLRNCMMLIGNQQKQRMQSLGMDVSDLFNEPEQVIMEVVKKQATFDTGVSHQIIAIEKALDELATVYSRIDPTLQASVEGEKRKMINALNALEEKANRALKRKNEVVVQQVRTLFNKLMPQGKLQERYDNVTTHAAEDIHGFIRKVINHTDPFRNSFSVIMDEG